MTSKEPQPMICPKANECRKRCITHHDKPHVHNEECDFDNCIEWPMCGLCIPVEPEPTCLHTWSWAEGQTHEVCSKCGEKGEQVVDNAKAEIAAILRKYDCLMIPVSDKQLKERLLAVLHTPADLQPEKHEGNIYDARMQWLKEEQRKAEQAPQMPLIKRVFGHNDNCTCTFCLTQITQRDADMAWHNEQIAEVASKAVKEFAEEFIKKIISCPISFYPDQLEAIKQGIRAMAEKKQLEYDPDRSKAHNSGRFQQRR